MEKVKEKLVEEKFKFGVKIFLVGLSGFISSKKNTEEERRIKEMHEATDYKYIESTGRICDKHEIGGNNKKQHKIDKTEKYTKITPHRTTEIENEEEIEK